MSESPKAADPIENTNPGTDRERLIYVVADPARAEKAEDEIDVRAVLRAIWDSKISIILITTVCTLAAVVYALMATEWYRAEVILAPVAEESESMLAGSLGGIASLAGLNLGRSGSTAEAMAILRAREFVGRFIEDNGLLQILYAEDWDAERGAWRETDPAEQPDIRDAILYFLDNVLGVSQDKDSQLATVSIQWTDPELAARWANELADRLNEQMRRRAEREAETNVAYLQEELSRTNLVTLQQTISRLLETELQKLMLARGNEEFAFRIIDAAQPPKYRYYPRRFAIVAFGGIVGGFIALVWVFLRRSLKADS